MNLFCNSLYDIASLLGREEKNDITEQWKHGVPPPTSCMRHLQYILILTTAFVFLSYFRMTLTNW